LGEFWKDFEELEFLEAGQRRGAHVSTLEIGSRDGVLCIGGILGFYAELRREIIWGNLDLTFFDVLLGVPRRCVEEGGTMCAFGGILCVNWGWFCELS
jgi:hypothetical protein